MWDDEPDAAPEPVAEGPPGRARTKVVTLVVVSLVMLATLCLCCIAARQLLRLINLEGPSLL